MFKKDHRHCSADIHSTYRNFTLEWRFAFDPESAASAKSKLLAIMEAARWAPSCFGDQPWRFIVICNQV